MTKVNGKDLAAILGGLPGAVDLGHSAQAAGMTLKDKDGKVVWSDKKEGAGSRGSTKWYYDAYGHVQYGEPPNGVLPEPGEPPEQGVAGYHGAKLGDTVGRSRRSTRTAVSR